MQTVVITGGTGLIGSALSKLLNQQRYQVVLLTRSAPKLIQFSPEVQPTTIKAHWDPARQEIDDTVIANADFILNLAGAGVADKRWTEDRKKEIVQSRIDSGKLLVRSLERIPNKVKAVVNASGVGWYGPDPQIPNPKPFTEDQPAYDDFLGRTCVAWEESIKPVSSLGKRLVILRTGIVMSNEGGALKEFKMPLNFGVAAILGTGKQIMSWIHIEDLCRIFLKAIEGDEMQGVYNAVAPVPATNKNIATTLARNKNGKLFLPIRVPAFALKLGLGEMSIEVLKSATVSSKKIEDAGFTFAFETIEHALKDLVGEKQ
ncbi:MAG: TIGR01777 family protein [Chitinophagaceae bacterium]|nr:TIGR01777 family protein [Chitinophagaceae bacterium]